MVVTVLAVSGVPGNVPQSLGKKVCILANLEALVVKTEALDLC